MEQENVPGADDSRSRQEASVQAMADRMLQLRSDCPFSRKVRFIIKG